MPFITHILVLTVYLVLDMSLPNLLKACLSIYHNCLRVSLHLLSSILSLQKNCFQVLLTLEALFNIADLVSSYKQSSVWCHIEVDSTVRPILFETLKQL